MVRGWVGFLLALRMVCILGSMRVFMVILVTGIRSGFLVGVSLGWVLRGCFECVGVGRGLQKRSRRRTRCKGVIPAPRSRGVLELLDG